MAKRKSRQRRNSILERTAGNGYWHMNGQNIPIKYNGEVFGHKTSLKYYHYDKNKKKVQTKWLMNEYRLKALSDDFEKSAELVLCRIQRTRTGSDVEEEFVYNYENQSSDFYNIANHQATLADQVQDPVNYDDWERPRSKRLKRDNINNGTQYGNTNYQQQEDYQQQWLDTGRENSTVAPPCYDMKHASKAGNEKGNAFGDDWMAMIEVPSPSVLLPFPDDVFKLEDYMMNASLNTAAATSTTTT
ncbi:NAC domain-containing protein 41-like [Dioscorea cayenensis subsp. rotundata]|uniref:NAC domain-containing protein 41-like n=1 Tax=Dioscorea cayennensis subsp. rotundata TaxID=55577 RepID=A0AB40CVC4_DIOCR|nr:NAC domain-containing protein 41-like [Dioscorea cayenensis subsp. rotundata]